MRPWPVRPTNGSARYPCAFVVPVGATRSIDTDALEVLCREHLAPYKVPVRIEIVDELPRNEIGKVCHLASWAPDDQQQDLHPRADRHHRAQPRQVHAPHDRQLVPHRPRGTQPALLRRVGDGRLDRSLARGGQHVGARRLGGLAANLEHELSHPAMQDPSLVEWWSVAAGFRSGGFDRIVEPAPWAPTIDELVAAGAGGAFYAHEIITVAPGAGSELPRRDPRGRTSDRRAALDVDLLGGFRVAMADDRECIAIWSFPDWPAWVAYEQAWTAKAPWRAGATR